MWQNIKIYVLAYAIMVAGALLSSIFQMVGDQFAVGHPISTVSANLSGMSIGGLIMVLGFIRDGRIEEERKRTVAAEARAQQAEAKAAAVEAQLEWERERAKAAEARAERLMDRYESVTESLVRRLEELNGGGR